MVAPAVSGMLDLLATHTLVGLGEMHGSTTEHAFLRQLIGHPDFAADLVIEFGTALYQDVLDDYVRGAEVPLEQLRCVWRDTTMSPINTWEHPIYRELLAAARARNRDGGQLRVLAGEPPIDWARIEKVEDWIHFERQRDSHYISVVENEVLARGRSALLLIGGMHLLRTMPHGLASRFADMPIVMPHSGSGARNDEVEALTSEWPIPSLAPIAGTPLASLGMEHFVGMIFDGEGRPKQLPSRRWDQMFDHFLYLGPAASLQWSDQPTSYESEFEIELKRRRDIVHSPGGIPILVIP